jgi:meiosis-specific transcription factor NDT80
MLPPTRSPGLGNSVSPSMGVSARDNYTTGTPGLHRHSHTTLSPRYPEISRYHSQPDTPRSVLPTTMPLNTYSTAYQTGSYSTHSGSSESPPFGTQENYGTITSEGSTVVPNIDAKIEKGFFMSNDRVWTCYRRNYFAVNVSFGLSPWTPNARLYLDQGNGKPQEQIQSMAVSLAAAVDGTAGKTIELIQHTPKRDKGPQLPMKKELLAPNPPGKNHDHSSYGLSNFHQPPSAPGPQLPLQQDGDSSQAYSPASHPSSNSLHAFERIQFKSATANNGKRRAQQQYYHLIVELWANVQNPRDQEPRWVKIAAKMSHPVVVRGRSPSHYQNEGPMNPTARGPGSSGFGGSGQNGLSSRGGTSYSSYGNGLSGNGTTAMGGNMYRGNTYSLDPSPAGSHSVSSASSLSGGPVEGLVGDQHMVDEDDAKMMNASHEYQYYPSALYDGLPSKAEGTLPLPERRAVKEEFPGPSSIATGWQIGGCGRFQGMESSRGYYPDVHTHTY